jgi:hypothetical protein
MALKGAIGDLKKTTNFFSLSLFQLSLSLILTSRVAVSTTSEARDVAAPRESASSRAAKSEERSRMVAFFFFMIQKRGKKLRVKFCAQLFPFLSPSKPLLSSSTTTKKQQHARSRQGLQEGRRPRRKGQEEAGECVICEAQR